MSPRSTDLGPLDGMRGETTEAQGRDRPKCSVVRDGEAVIVHVCALQEGEEKGIVFCSEGEGGVGIPCIGEGGGALCACQNSDSEAEREEAVQARETSSASSSRLVDSRARSCVVAAASAARAEARKVAAEERSEGAGAVFWRCVTNAVYASRSQREAERREERDERSRDVHSVQTGWSISERAERRAKSRFMRSVSWEVSGKRRGERAGKVQGGRLRRRRAARRTLRGFGGRGRAWCVCRLLGRWCARRFRRGFCAREGRRV